MVRPGYGPACHAEAVAVAVSEGGFISVDPLLNNTMTKKEIYNLTPLILLLVVIMAVGGSFYGNFILGLL